MTSIREEKEKALKYLEGCFQGDEQALEAIRFLWERDKGASGGKKMTAVSKGRFPLPVEVAGKEGRFALFSDGACRGNPGPGAWGAMGQNCRGEVLFESNGLDYSTTNNRMELEGAIYALEGLEHYIQQNFCPSPEEVFLFSDSKYVVDGMTTWIKKWKRQGWKKADKTAPSNLDLWKRLDDASSKFSLLKFYWVQGHSGHPQNEHVDQLANKALDEG